MIKLFIMSASAIAASFEEIRVIMAVSFDLHHYVGDLPPM